MDLAAFLADDTLGGGSWADDSIDFNQISIPVENKSSMPLSSAGNVGFGARGGANPMDPAFGRSSRQEFPVPTAPPYIALVNNLPWEAVEEDIELWLNTGVNDGKAVINVSAPRDRENPDRLKGFAFVTFDKREQLEAALNLTGDQEFFGRSVFINVADPSKAHDRSSSRFGSGADLDWGAARTGSGSEGRRGFGSRGDEPDLDWGAARSDEARPTRSFRSDENRGDRRPRREEPELDWGAARTDESRPTRTFRSDEQRAERRPRREEPELDWGAARTEAAKPSRSFRSEEPRERKPRREEPELDWGAARSTEAEPKPSRPFRPSHTSSAERKPRRQGPELDWGAARTDEAKPARTNTKKASASAGSESKPIASQSAYAVLAGDDDDEEDEEEEGSKEKDQAAELTSDISKLSV